RDRTAAHPVVGGAAGQAGDAGTGDHGLGEGAAHIVTRAANVLPFDDRGAAAGAARVQGQRFARLAGAHDDGVKTLPRHENAPTTKKVSAAATLPAGGNLVAVYEVIATDETRWQTAADRRLQEGNSQDG